jgi:5'(3')-deoxyribonucleotidase
MPKPANRKTIAVDIDDVLAAHADSFVAYSNKKWGTSLKPDDYDEHWAEMWRIDDAESNRRREEIIKDKLFLTYPFFPDASPVLRQLSKSYKLVVLTSRHKGIIEDTAQWIGKEYGDIFEEVHSAGIWDEVERPIAEKVALTKGDIAKQIGADYLIDDQPKHCLAAAEAGLTALLFGDYRWNRDIKLPKNVYRAKTWQTVQEFFDAAR